MTTSDLIDQALGLVIDAQLSVEEATQKTLVDADIDSDTMEHLVWVGLNRLVHQELVRVRRTGAGQALETDEPDGPRSGRYQLRTRPTEGAKAIYHLWKPYQAADGSQKPLYDFTVEDWRYNRDRAAGRVEGLQRHLDLFSLGYSLVDGRKVETAADLSITARDKLEAAAARAFQVSAVTE